MNMPQDLQPGDWLGYHHKGSLLAEAIYLRTGGRATHSAVFHDNGPKGPMVVTSLENGVNIYPMDMSGLVIVRRPAIPFLIESADVQFWENMKGRPYGYFDCLKDMFPDLKDSEYSMNCSHASAQFYLYGGLFLFASDFDLKTITPRDFELVPDCLLKTIWMA